MDAAHCEALFEAIEASTQIMAPSFIRLEVANAIWRYVKAEVLPPAEALSRHAEALMLIDSLVDEGSLFPEALAMAVEQQHPVYDTVYAVLARREAATLLTFDKRLAGLCKRLSIGCQLFGG